MKIFKQIFIRYIAVSLALSMLVLLREPGEGLFIVGVALITSIKFLIFDGLMQLIRLKKPQYFDSNFYYAGFVGGVLIDVFAYFAASSGETDAGFALLITVLFSPWLLFGALVGMIIYRLFLLKRGK